MVADAINFTDEPFSKSSLHFVRVRTISASAFFYFRWGKTATTYILNLGKLFERTSEERDFAIGDDFEHFVSFFVCVAKIRLIIYN